MLKKKNVLLGVTGGIAAFKTPYIVRSLIKLGATVQVIQTKASKEFISPLVLSTLSRNKVFTDLIDEESKEWNNHVELSLWADYFIIAPATLNTMSKMVQGLCGNLLMSVYFSAKCPVYIAPAMDLDMYSQTINKSNISTLIEKGDKVIMSNFGELASGLKGFGRMSEPEEIISYIIDDINKSKDFYNKTCLITAGPTQEDLDPVRFLSNRSSGKMGAELSLELANRGAVVFLIMGPSNCKVDHPNIRKINIISSDDMFEQSSKIFPEVDIAIFAAAVSDYKPKSRLSNKIKKKTNNFSLDLVKTIDISLELSRKKKRNQMLVGFSLESDNELFNAKKKLIDKNFDLIIMNSLKNVGTCFDSDDNKVTIIDSDGLVSKYKLKNKSKVAKDIADKIIIKINS